MFFPFLCTSAACALTGPARGPLWPKLQSRSDRWQERTDMQPTSKALEMHHHFATFGVWHSRGR